MRVNQKVNTVYIQHVYFYWWRTDTYVTFWHRPSTFFLRCNYGIVMKRSSWSHICTAVLFGNPICINFTVPQDMHCVLFRSVVCANGSILDFPAQGIHLLDVSFHTWCWWPTRLAFVLLYFRLPLPTEQVLLYNLR